MAMRRQRGEGSIYRWRETGWRGEIDLGYVAGVRKRKVVYGKSQDAVLRKMRDARKQIEAGNLATSSMRLDVWLRYWLDNVAPQRRGRPAKPKTLADYRSKVEQYIIPTIGTHKLDRLTPAHVREMHKALRARGDLSETTVHHAHRVLCNALNAAMTEVGLTRNVAEVVPAPSKPKPATAALTVDQVRRVLMAAAEDRNASRWLFAFLTGARQGECLGLRWPFVHLDHLPYPTADLAWQLQRVGYRHGCDGTCEKTARGCPSKVLNVAPALECLRLEGNLCLLRPKTIGSQRVVPLVAPLEAALQLHREQDTTPNPHGLVWHRADGSPIPPHEDWAAWKTLLERAEVEGMTLHEARHTTVTLLSDLGIDRRVIADIVGHSNVLTQAGYRHGNTSLAGEALAKLGVMLAIEPAG